MTKIPEEWDIEQALLHLKLARYLISCADERSRTHGEKHHFHFVALAEIAKALFKLSAGDFDTTLLSRYDSTDPADIYRSRF